MSCEDVRQQMHDFIDQRLSAAESVRLDAHLEVCERCRRVHDDFTLMCRTLAVRHFVPEAASRQMLRQLERSRHRGLRVLAAEVWEYAYTFCRDLDRPVLWSKLSAVPVTLAFFVVLLLQFSPPSHNLMLPVFSGAGWADDHVKIHSVRLSPKQARMNGLVNAAWKMPYEDSLSVLAEFTPQGDFVRIDDVLEHPKSIDLLNAVDLTLQGSRFEPMRDGQRPRYAIFFFQKIDVYEGL